jgi:hypothetical protein
MRLKEALKLLEDNDYRGWIAKTKNPSKTITKDDLIDEWYHSEITNAVLNEEDNIAIEEKKTTVPTILPATHYRIIGLGEKAVNEK